MHSKAWLIAPGHPSHAEVAKKLEHKIFLNGQNFGTPRYPGSIPPDLLVLHGAHHRSHVVEPYSVNIIVLLKTAALKAVAVTG